MMRKNGKPKNETSGKTAMLLLLLLPAVRSFAVNDVRRIGMRRREDEEVEEEEEEEEEEEVSIEVVVAIRG